MSPGMSVEMSISTENSVKSWTAPGVSHQLHSVQARRDRVVVSEGYRQKEWVIRRPHLKNNGWIPIEHLGENIGEALLCRDFDEFRNVVRARSRIQQHQGGIFLRTAYRQVEQRDGEIRTGHVDLCGGTAAGTQVCLQLLDTSVNDACIELGVRDLRARGREDESRSDKTRDSV